jgi:hypothetical protein
VLSREPLKFKDILISNNDYELIWKKFQLISLTKV